MSNPKIVPIPGLNTQYVIWALGEAMKCFKENNAVGGAAIVGQVYNEAIREYKLERVSERIPAKPSTDPMPSSIAKEFEDRLREHEEHHK